MTKNLSTENLPQLTETWLTSLNWQPRLAQQAKFQQLYQEILIGNQQLNLTRITQPLEFWEKHLWDSLAAILQTEFSQQLPNNQNNNLAVIDIGTGAGFPGIPIAIVQPEWQVTLVDSTRKKIKFVNSLSQKLQLINTKTIAARAETLGQTTMHRENYDLALIRAVSLPSVCAEYTIPLLKIGGMVILYRGHWQTKDTQELESAVAKLGGKIELIKEISTPISQSIRHCLYLRKISSPSRVGQFSPYCLFP